MPIINHRKITAAFLIQGVTRDLQVADIILQCCIVILCELRSEKGAVPLYVTTVHV